MRLPWIKDVCFRGSARRDVCTGNENGSLRRRRSRECQLTVRCEQPAASREICDPGPSTGYAELAKLRRGRTFGLGGHSGLDCSCYFTSMQISSFVKRQLPDWRAVIWCNAGLWSAFTVVEISGASIFDALTTRRLAGAAEAEGKPQPPHKYKLSRRVAEALLPVYQCLLDSQLLEQCKG
ncbi:hypothetical protein HPB48_015473 [Haemaphysalis longicornis]|uniref:Uncharacterized protein n=1 Tax=Haemaphysalis longicornis TaxID=44386 RepID=A0A9J6FHW2_HAELO|nr:hypothetical protein HPB48_015473 [Haemaphysalis longicornis]